MRIQDIHVAEMADYSKVVLRGKSWRFCKYCHKRLSIYNLNNHCLNAGCKGRNSDEIYEEQLKSYKYIRIGKRKEKNVKAKVKGPKLSRTAWKHKLYALSRLRRGEG